jgi:hypothetical protein
MAHLEKSKILRLLGIESWLFSLQSSVFSSVTAGLAPVRGLSISKNFMEKKFYEI